jgi:hypothetical protein
VVLLKLAEEHENDDGNEDEKNDEQLSDTTAPVLRAIVIGVDDSSFAEQTVEWACKNLLKTGQDRVYIVNVRPKEDQREDDSFMLILKYTEKLRGLGIEKCSKMLENSLARMFRLATG